MRPTPGATSAARTYLRAHLGWLRGFPIREGKGGFTWQTVPGLGVEEQPRTIEVDREHVRKSVFAINRVQAKFPKAFVQVVDDADEWLWRMDWRIAHFKNVIHDGNALPNLMDLLDALNARRALVKRTEALTERTALAGLIEALAWVCLQDQAKLEQRLSIIEDNSAAFEVLVKNDSLILALNLIDFLCEGVGQKLLTLLGDADVWTTPTSTLGHISKLREYLSTFRATGGLDGSFAVDGLALPSADSAGNLIDFLKRTTSMSAGHRRLRMSLLEAQIDHGITGLWQKWWHDINLLEGDMRRALSGEMPFKARRSVVKTYRQKLQQCEECTPQLGYTLSAAENAAILADHGTLAHEFLALSAELALPPAQFHALASAWKPELTLTFSSRVIREVIAGLRLLLPKLPSEGRTTASILESVVLDVAEHWVTGTKPVVLLKPWFGAKIAWIEEDRDNGLRHVDSYLAYSLLTVVERTRSDTDAAKVMMALSEWQPDNDLLGTLLELVDGDPEVFAALADTFQADMHSVNLATAMQHLAKSNNKPLVLEGLKAGESKTLCHIALLAQLARSMGCATDLPKRAARPFDLSPYPEGLHPQLEELASWDENVVTAVDSILGTDYPRPERVQQELDTLRKLVSERPEDTGGLSLRIAKLERQLTQSQPGEITKIKQAKYHRKLAKRLRHAKFVAWEAKLLHQLKHALAKEQIGDPADLLTQSGAVEVLWAISDLKGSMRRLGWRLVKARLGPQPWDMRAAPENSAFIEKLALKGINTSAWLDGIAPYSGTMGAYKVELTLEDDPVHIMRMGAPFQTCLAPGDFNFFSAVSNAADINKRVLYARDKAGEIRARCLLGLTDAGEIVAFNVYCHDHREDATGLVTRYIRGLAVAMNTIAVPHGKIRRLVAPQWYDDGPCDLTGQLEAIQQNSPFDLALPGLAASEFINALGKALGEVAVTPAVLETLIGLDNFRKRVELIEPLLPVLDRLDLEPHRCAAVADMVSGSGHPELARAMVDSAAKSLDGEDIYGIVALANAYTNMGTPERALQLLRRHADILSNWSNATMARANALEKLRRPRQALSAYKLAKTQGAVVPRPVFDTLERQLQN